MTQNHDSDPKWLFENRRQAGEALARSVQDLALERPIILAIPPESVTLAQAVAKSVKAPLDLAVVLELPGPIPPAHPIGHVVGGIDPHIVMEETNAEDQFIPPGYVDEERRRLVSEAERRHHAYTGNRNPLKLQDRHVVLVCDVDLPERRLKAALAALAKIPLASLRLAFPAMSIAMRDSLPDHVRQVLCLHVAQNLPATIYRQAEAISDEHVPALVGETQTD
ncbi:hypothetical protein NAC44_08505 [Allorhizobium sp. BGMRC 0089]|uniref:hypothetical protein n=1 Tax=Allorhizobium sonneratiae TaxID=2934936 RepID=UPI002033B071|nr:hypothetical protein [Allorhizobium sonneratiae]MCM2292369.1 hypothetical protein [Allorhizobium sonneratiae]